MRNLSVVGIDGDREEIVEALFPDAHAKILLKERVRAQQIQRDTDVPIKRVHEDSRGGKM